MISIKRIQAHETLPIRQGVMYPWKKHDNLILPGDNEALHLGLFDNELLVSIISLFITGDTAQFRKLATLDDRQGQGYGRQLLHYVIDYSKAQGIKMLWCNARKNKSGFYQKSGFKETEVEFHQDGYDFVVMKLNFYFA